MTSLTDEQRQSVETIDCNVLVSAGAGSGKTHVLVERYIEILRCHPDLSVSNLVAVTYTTKAANEMRSRLKARMQELMKAAGGVESERWSACLSGVDGARIGTIHSLCESILKAFPVEAAIDPRFEVLNELERAELLDSCLERAIREAAAEGEDGALLLAYPVEQIKSWVNGLISSVLQFQESRECLKGLDDDALAHHCRKLLQSQQRLTLEKVFTSRSWGNLDFLRHNPWSKGGLLEEHRLSYIRLADAAAGDCGAQTGADETGWRLSQLTEIANIKVGNAGGNTEEAKQLRAVMRELKEFIRQETKDLPGDLYGEDLEAFKSLRGIVGMTDRVLQLFGEEKKVGMRLDFNDMIWSAYQVLSRPGSHARKFFNESVRAILVDEFQDTNRLQAKLIHMLAGEGTRFFLIGDDKQSIYKFQGADVSIFNEWRAVFGRGKSDPTVGEAAGNGDLVELCGDSLLVNLGISFRSHTQIVSFVNAVFERLMADEIPAIAYKARFRPLEAFREDAAEEPRVDIEMFNATDSDGERRSEDARRLEARTVAAWIAEKVLSEQTITDKSKGGERAIRFGDFAVLVQRNDEFKEIEAALSDLEIPYVTMAASGFLNKQEVFDLENILRFLWCPEDCQSLFGVLRSPMFGVADDEIHQLLSGPKTTLWSACLSFSRDMPGQCPELERAVEVLRALLASAKSKALGELVRRVIAATKYDITLLAAGR